MYGARENLSEESSTRRNVIDLSSARWIVSRVDRRQRYAIVACFYGENDLSNRREEVE